MEQQTKHTPLLPWSAYKQKGTIGHCSAAQIFDVTGKAIIMIEPTKNEEDANKLLDYVMSLSTTAAERDSLKIELDNLKDDITEWDSRLSSSEVERDSLKAGKNALEFAHIELIRERDKLREEVERLKNERSVLLKDNTSLRDINKSLVEALELVDKRLNLHLHPEGTIGYDVYNKVKAAISQAKALNP